MFWIWMAAAVVFLIIELLTPTFIFLCFVAGAAVAGIFGEFNPESYYWQIGLFVIVSVLLLPLSRRMAKRITKPSPQESNVDAMVGKTALVVAAIDPDSGGKIRYEGEVWQARSRDRIEENAKVRIVAVTGTRVQVEKVIETSLKG